MDKIKIRGARIHNLKNLNLDIPKNKLIAITGVSGSGKSSLAFDLLFEEGRTRYLQAIGLPPRIENEKKFDSITGLSPTIAVEQRTIRYINPRSTVGTRTGIYNLLRMLFAIEGTRLCPICKEFVNNKNICETCGMTVDPLEIKHFSFNEPSGMCLKCSGRGYIREFLQEKIIPNEDWNLIEICNAASGSFAALRSWMPSLAEHYGFNIETAYKDLPQNIQKTFLYGTGSERIHFKMKSKQYVHEAEKNFEGIIPHLHRAMEKSVSNYRQKKIEQIYMDKMICPDCDGFRINQQARESKIQGKHIGELAHFSIIELISFLSSINHSSLKTENGRAVLDKINQELSKFELVGLSYLHLNRGTRTLSGGENQRLNLMTQLNLGLGGVVLILDEPTIGLHEIEKKNLGMVLMDLKNQGNTIIIVEHDERLIMLSDEIIDLGPKAGIEGGQIVFQGTLDGLQNEKNSLTGNYLKGILKYPRKGSNSYRKGQKSEKLELFNISTNNLRNLSLKIPLGIMVGIAGVSGSGKSSLISDTLVPLLQKQIKYLIGQNKIKSDQENGNGSHYNHETKDPLEIIRGKIEGWQHIDECIIVDQSPIGRNRNSFPASYIGLWDVIRKLFARQPLAKKRKYKEGHFSFNSERGRCSNCKGEGRVTLQISFLDEISIPCEECEGKRYLPEILEIKYKDLNIKDVLDLSVSDSIKIFKDEQVIFKFLQILDEIGMGYITLGQSARTLSGGEAQRIKLAKALGSSKKTNSLFVLDEPTTGLHFHDEVKLLKLLDDLVEQGNSVIIIEHNTKILSFCDWLIELGPGGGPQGGKIIAEGSPKEIKNDKNSIIGKFLLIES